MVAQEGSKHKHERGPKTGGEGWRTAEGRSAVVSRIKWHAERLGKIQLKCGVKTGFEVGHGA